MTPANSMGVSSFFLWCFVVGLSHGMTDADLTPRALSTLSASVNCTGSLLTLAQPRAPSKVAKFWGWEYEARLQGSCRRLFKDKNEEAAWPPPRWEALTLQQQAAYTLNGQIGHEDWHWANRQNGASTKRWDEGEIARHIANARRNVCHSSYRNGDGSSCCGAMRKYKRYIDGQRGLVLGSQLPWVESLLLAHGAAHVTTIEYMPTECVPSAGARDSPCSRMRIIHPKLAASEYLAAVSGEETNRRDSNSTAQWDFAFTYSSYEHDGLGRYGDPLNPSGDIESVQKVRCQLKPGGLLFIGVPTARRDLLVWNAHRIYGPKRLPLLSANFEVLDVLGHAPSGTTDATRLHRYEKRGRWMFQHIIVLRKPLVEKFRKGKHAAV